MDHFADWTFRLKGDDTHRDETADRWEVKVNDLSSSANADPAYHSSELDWKLGPLSQWLFSALGEAGLAMVLPFFCSTRLQNATGPNEQAEDGRFIFLIAVWAAKEPEVFVQNRSHNVGDEQ